jgi:predicted MPP superfamily phosphohydrolase
MRTLKIKTGRRRIFSALGVLAVLLIVDAFVVEPNLISVHTAALADQGLSEVLQDKKVVLISDLHIASLGYREKSLIGKLQKIHPDILFITGDFITDGKNGEACLEVLRRIGKPEHGIWAVLGNSDRYLNNGRPNKNIGRFVERLRALGVRVLEDEGASVDIDPAREPLTIIGVEGSSLSRAKLDRLLRSVPPHAPTIMLSHFPGILQARPDALIVNLEEKEGKGVSGWGWQDNAYFEDDTGDVRFEKSGVHTLRVQSREDGVAIDQICLVPRTEGAPLFDPNSDRTTAAAASPMAPGWVLIETKNMDDARVFGAWKKIPDPTAASGLALKDIPGLGMKEEAAVLKPADYFEADFFAEGGLDYHLWVRMKAEDDSTSKDSAYFQFNDSIGPDGEPAYRIGAPGIRNGLRKVNLVLAGHNHGGQVHVPLIGSVDIIPHHKIFFERGFFKTQGTKIYVNRGIGTAVLPVRFFSRPEITVFRFVNDRTQPPNRQAESARWP